MRMVDMSKPLVLVVEDEPIMQELIAEELTCDYQVTVASSGHDCIAALAARPHHLILLDVQLPNLDGYEICRMIKTQESTAEIPVIFVSGRDSSEDRIKGYEAGGADYITKPFIAAELRAKVAHLLQLYWDHSTLRILAQDASQTAITAETSLGEMGILTKCLRSLQGCNDLSSFTDAMLHAISDYGVTGTVQLRVLDQQITRSNRAESTPLELSVIGLLASMDRVLQYKSRLSIAYPSVSLLINNMPKNDPDRCRRLSEHLEILCGTVEIGVMALARTEAIRSVIRQIAEIFSEIEKKQQRQHIMTYVAISELNATINTALISMGLTDTQEEFLLKIINEGIEDFMSIENTNISIQERLKAISSRLTNLL
ncbi:Response regulatory domain-containing protein [Gammaproteobacteria bacterium]